VPAGHGPGSLSDTLCLLVRLTLLPRVVRWLLQRNRVAILLYHRPARSTFARHVRTLRKIYNLIPLESLVAALEHGTVNELPPRSLVLTFDDGHRSNYELLDVIRELPARPTIFLCSGIVGTESPYWFDVVADPEGLKRVSDEERLTRLAEVADGAGLRRRAALTVDEVKELRPYVDFQSHTVSHPILPRCSAEKALQELMDSRTQLESTYALAVYAVAYPNGDYSPRELLLARRAGYRCGVTVDFGLNGQATDPFRLKRIAVNDDEDGPNVVVLKACGIWGAVRSLLRRLPRRLGRRGAG
jgi:peptidoglycan/xylan/chitin deacetylase (PgdA/CDA1 family)